MYISCVLLKDIVAKVGENEEMELRKKCVTKEGFIEQLDIFVA